ncbi:MAG: zinc-binding dehydrogenase, partial [Planctomycetota bacterium]
AAARNVPAWRLVPVPAEIDDVAAAALLLKGLTAEFLVRRVFKVGPGHRVLVHAAAGGVGTLLCPWLRHVGATVIGVVSAAAKAEVARAAGCHHVIVRDHEDVGAMVGALTGGKGVDVVYDSVGKATLRESLACLRKRGLLVSFGNASGRPDPLALSELQAGSFFVTRPTLHDYTATRPELLRAAEVLFALVAGGVLQPRVHATLPLADAVQAHQLLESRQTTGAIVLVP